MHEVYAISDFKNKLFDFLKKKKKNQHPAFCRSHTVCYREVQFNVSNLKLGENFQTKYYSIHLIPSFKIFRWFKKTRPENLKTLFFLLFKNHSHPFYCPISFTETFIVIQFWSKVSIQGWFKDLSYFSHLCSNNLQTPSSNLHCHFMR